MGHGIWVLVQDALKRRTHGLWHKARKGVAKVAGHARQPLEGTMVGLGEVPRSQGEEDYAAQSYAITASHAVLLVTRSWEATLCYHQSSRGYSWFPMRERIRPCTHFP
jgi:hypothetical protein